MPCPGFQPPVVYPTLGSAANDVFLGDFNGDGFIDMVVTNNGSDTISIFFNTGTGEFVLTPESPFPVGSSPNNIVAADLTGDGSLDLVVANTNSADISILFNNGNGVFSNAPGSPLSLGPGTSPFAIAAADFNGDGFIDLAITNSKTPGSTTIILLNDGSGIFSEAAGSPISGFSEPLEIVAADFNQDGKMDLAIANLLGDVSLLFGNGDGTFNP